MIKSIQLELQFPVASSRGRREAAPSKKRQLITGRPRRLRADFPKLSDQDWNKIENLMSTGLTPEQASEPYARKPEVIKIAIPAQKMDAIDRIRTRLAGGSTRPDAVRIAVLKFVQDNENLIGTSRPGDREKRKVEDGQRCMYVKIPFEPSIAAKIGHQEWVEHPQNAAVTDLGLDTEEEYILHPATGLCAALNMTRQQVIARAIDSFLREMR